ncbi:MAG: sulfotransferase domain-containing protein, partial [Anaerolineales bacterium]|nr:sulfotransferase domain-containing protein [Anaerolineales bacterium]
SDGWPQWASSIEEYEQLFSDCVGKKAIGEASPFYFSDPESAEKISAALGRNAKIVIALRNPAKRAYSHWAHEHYKYNRDPLSFHQALELEDERANSAETRKLKHYYSGIFHYVWVSMYADKVQQYMDMFGRQNVKVIILEEFIKSPGEQFAALCRFLEIDDSVTLELTQSNAASETLSPNLTRAISKINQSKLFVSLYQKMPFVLKKLIFNTGNALFEALQRPLKKKSAVEDSLDEKTYQQLMQGFLPDIHKLEKILERDLSVWYRAA